MPRTAQRWFQPGSTPLGRRRNLQPVSRQVGMTMPLGAQGPGGQEKPWTGTGRAATPERATARCRGSHRGALTCREEQASRGSCTQQHLEGREGSRGAHARGQAPVDAWAKARGRDVGGGERAAFWGCSRDAAGPGPGGCVRGGTSAGPQNSHLPHPQSMAWFANRVSADVLRLR